MGEKSPQSRSPHELRENRSRKSSSSSKLSPARALQSLALERSSKYVDEYEGLARIDEAPKEDSKVNTIVEFEHFSSKFDSRRNSLNISHAPGASANPLSISRFVSSSLSNSINALNPSDYEKTSPI